MIDLEVAQKQVLAECQELNPQLLPLSDALGCVATQEVVAAESMPPFDNSAMDGFALVAADTKSSPTQLKIVSTIRAGQTTDTELATGEAMKIMTGAPIPKGADAVIEVEKTSQNDETVTITEEVKVGNYIRQAGENIKAGQKILQKKKILTPARLGILASQGIYEISVFPKCKVGVISTGSELVEGTEKLDKGKIRDSNRHILLALIEKAGMEAIDLGIIEDTEKSVWRTIKSASKYCNALITSGGVSMGDYDFVKKVLEEKATNGTSIQVAVKPSKPLAYGRYGELMVFGLPGNPVSALVSFELFARPGLRKMMGFDVLHRPKTNAIAQQDIPRSPDGKMHYVRVKWKFKNGEHQIRNIEAQGSHQLQGLAEANGLAILLDGYGAKAGDRLDLICLD